MREREVECGDTARHAQDALGIFRVLRVGERRRVKGAGLSERGSEKRSRRDSGLVRIERGDE
jgi:hypothetical protein